MLKELYNSNDLLCYDLNVNTAHVHCSVSVASHAYVDYVQIIACACLVILSKMVPG